MGAASTRRSRVQLAPQSIPFASGCVASPRLPRVGVLPLWGWDYWPQGQLKEPYSYWMSGADLTIRFAFVYGFRKGRSPGWMATGLRPSPRSRGAAGIGDSEDNVEVVRRLIDTRSAGGVADGLPAIEDVPS